METLLSGRDADASLGGASQSRGMGHAMNSSSLLLTGMASPTYTLVSSTAPDASAAEAGVVALLGVSSPEYDIQLGAALLALHSQLCEGETVGADASVRLEMSAFRSAVKAARVDVMGSLAPASMESYHR